MRIFLWPHAGSFWWIREDQAGHQGPGTLPAYAHGPYATKEEAYDAALWVSKDIYWGEPPCVSYPLPDEEEL